MEPKSLETKSLDDLRALARTAGLRGYSGLRKKQLIELLLKPKAVPTLAAASKKKVNTRDPQRKTDKPVKIRAKPSVRSRTNTGTETTTTQTRVETAKFEMTPPQTQFKQSFVSSLEEDIERLSSPDEPVLCLLPQKPGVVHAYWALRPGAPKRPLRLRLCNTTTETIQLLEEIEISGERGHWYFQIPDLVPLGDLFAQLGFYDDNGGFVTAIRRGIARIPSLYASGETDRSWWISEEDFRAMYQRAGGIVHDQRLTWPGSASSETLIVKNKK